MSNQPALGLQQIAGDEVSMLRVSIVAANNANGEQRRALGERLSAIGAEIAAMTHSDALEQLADAPPPAPAAPALVLQREHKTINYMCLPEGHELAPFRAAIAALTNKSPRAPEWAAAITEEAELWVFVAAACPHCPEAVRTALQVTIACPTKIALSVIDAQRYPELAERHGARSVPLTVIDRELGLTGVIDAETLADHLANRHSTAHEAALFIAAVEGGPETAAKLLLDGQAARFVAAWKSSTTSLRMGMLLAAEEALDARAEVLDAIVGDLLALAGADDPALRGDTIDLLSKIGHPNAAETLRALLDDSDEDIAELAAEGLAAIEQRGAGK